MRVVHVNRKKKQKKPKIATMLKTTLLSLPQIVTSNLSKAHVTRDSSGSATLAISVQHAIKQQCVLKG